MNVLAPTRENLTDVAHRLRDGKLAILPTETVYGLAADATNEYAVTQIFALKGRPANNPLIVHISNINQMGDFADKIPPNLDLLVNAFMPGPLTVVLPKRSSVSSLVTGGLDTVAIRMPDHAACLAVMELGGLALAMPSANPFMGLSPTAVEIIDPSLAAGVSAIVDGGPCAIGIESTVLDLTGEPMILRAGSITRDEIETVLQQHVGEGGDSQKSPGMYKRHYAPRTSCRVTRNVSPTESGLVFHEPANEDQIQMPSDPKDYARLLYAAMAELDSRELSIFLIQAPPMTPEWTAVWDRLTKATA